jgi:predicted nucleotidyltransferase
MLFSLVFIRVHSWFNCMDTAKLSLMSVNADAVQMKIPPLEPRELALMRGVFERHPEVEAVTLFGSRAKGGHSPQSDVDLALTGRISPLRAEAIAAELDELPLPYRFDVQPLEHINFAPLLERIRRVGIVIYEGIPAAAGNREQK